VVYVLLAGLSGKILHSGSKDNLTNLKFESLTAAHHLNQFIKDSSGPADSLWRLGLFIYLVLSISHP
jgi:hypothetical protein